jgi:integrase
MSRSGVRFPEAAPPLTWENSLRLRAGLTRVESNVVRVALQCVPWLHPQYVGPGGSAAASRSCPAARCGSGVYAGTDPLTGRRHYLRESIPAGPNAHAEAQKAMRRLGTPVDERRNLRTNATVDQLLDRHFELAELEDNTLANYRSRAEKHIRPLIGSVKVGALDGDLFDSFYATLRRCRDHCGRRQRIDHRTDGSHQCDDRCKPHQCRPLSNGSVRYIHFILSGALKRAVRWRWIATNLIAQAVPPPQPKPNPQPPTAEQAARILNEVWPDPDWAMLVWLTMVTGFRRGELCAIRWRHLDLAAGVLTLEKSLGQRSGRTWEKDTKTHQHRRIALDPDTVLLLSEHRHRCEERAAALELALSDDAFVFSLAVDGSVHLKPDSVSQRYARLARRLGISTTIHKLRHYSATELISAGVDVRTMAGRLGHGGGERRRSRSTQRGCPRATSARPRACSPGYLPGLMPPSFRLLSVAAVVTPCTRESLPSCAHRLPQVSCRSARSSPRISSGGGRRVTGLTRATTGESVLSTPTRKGHT